MPTSLGPAEILVILIVALIVLGPNKLPGAARQVGKTLAEVRRWSQGFQDEIRTVIDPELAPPYPTVSSPPAPSPEPTPLPILPAETSPARAEAAGNGHVPGHAPPEPAPADPSGPPAGEPPRT